jgi:hypothetical protein
MPAPRGYSRPEFHVPVTLQSAHAHRVVGRSLIGVARALYGIDVVLHAIGDARQMEEVGGLVDSLLGAFAQRLDEEIARVETLKSAKGIAAVPRYTNPSRGTFRISSPQLSHYDNLIQALDRLTVGIDTLSMQPVICRICAFLRAIISKPCGVTGPASTAFASMVNGACASSGHPTGRRRSRSSTIIRVPLQ